MSVQTQLSASVDASKTPSGERAVTVSVVDADGRELLTRIDAPLADEEAYWRVGNRCGALERLGIPFTLTAAARELKEWWETDRFAVLYMRYGRKEQDEHPTLELAWKGADAIEEVGTGSVYEIREVVTDRLLYSKRNYSMKGWVRETDDVPPVEEMEGVIA